MNFLLLSPVGGRRGSLGPAVQEEHHQPGVTAEGGHVDGAPPVPGGHHHVRPVSDQELSDVSTGVSSLLGHRLKRGEALAVVLVDVDTLQVLLQEPLQLGPLAERDQVQEVSLKVRVGLDLRSVDCLDGESGHGADGGQHGLVDCAAVFGSLGHFITRNCVSLQTPLALGLGGQPVVSVEYDHVGVVCAGVTSQLRTQGIRPAGVRPVSGPVPSRHAGLLTVAVGIF